LECSPSPDPASFGAKSSFLVSYSSNPSCIPNLKLLASVVAEINRGSEFFLDAPLAQTPASFGPKSFLGKPHPKPKLCTKFEVVGLNGCRNNINVL